MKKLNFFISIVVLIILNCSNYDSNQNKNAQKSESSTFTRVEFKPNSYDLGILSKDTIATALFYIKNIGEETLIIKDVRPECNCAGYNLENSSVSPADSARLIINFNTKNKGIGLHRMVISIRSNTKKEYNTIFVKCKIR